MRAMLLTMLSAGLYGQIPAPVRISPPPRIMEFRIEPSTIHAGNPAVLVWAAENSDSVTIDPQPGIVTARGSAQLRPQATTTYTITATGLGQSLTRQVTLTVVGTSPATVHPSKSTPQAVPRTAEGRPDLTGVYGFNPGEARVNARNLLVDGPQLKTGTENFRVIRPENHPGTFSNCMPIAGPPAYAVPYPFQIIQARDQVVILHEFPGVFRIIPIGAPHPVDPDPAWLGHSVARWDEETLVIDTVGFNTKTELSGFRHSESLHIVERFSRLSFDTLRYEATIEDSLVFVRPWTVTYNFKLRPELRKIDEFICENQKDYTGLFGN